MKNAVQSCKESADGAGRVSARAEVGRHVRVVTRAALVVPGTAEHATAAIAASSLSKVVDGMTIHVGIVPPQIIRGQSMDHASGAMHGGAFKGDQYHVLVALLDAKTGQRTVDAEVEVSAAEFEKTGPTVTLGLMKFAESVTYGNYFDLPGSEPFRIDLKIRRSNVARVVEA